ncbi:MAG: hypothetical protein Q7K26_06685 [bacterium]|nr:hypothetical protein [bacterium]
MHNYTAVLLAMVAILISLLSFFSARQQLLNSNDPSDVSLGRRSGRLLLIVLAVAILVFIKEPTAEWRVRNIPTLSTSTEQAEIARVDLLIEIAKSIEEAWRGIANKPKN